MIKMKQEINNMIANIINSPELFSNGIDEKIVELLLKILKELK